MKYTVHLFPVVRLKVPNVEAPSQTEAVAQALAERQDLEILLHRPACGFDYADEISHFLVDEVGDEEHQNSQFYEADGRTPLADKRLVIGVNGGTVSSIVASTAEIKAAMVADYDTDGTPDRDLRDLPPGQKCFCYPFEVQVDPAHVAKCFAALEQVPESASAVKRIRDILFLDTDNEGLSFINPDKEWSGADTLDQIAAVIRQAVPVEPMPKIPAELMEEFLNLADKLSPESLTHDGELSADAAEQQRQHLLREWGLLEVQAGRKVAEEEVWNWNTEKYG